MNYFNEDDFYDKSVNSELDAFIENIKTKAKKEFIDRLNKLEKENQELQEIKRNYKNKIYQLERDYDNKKCELEKEYKDKEYNLYRRPINEIFPFVSKPYYEATVKYDYIPKCDKCDENRQFIYIDPLNREHKFDCTCNKKEFSGYEVEEKVINFISEISIRNGKPCMWVDFNVKRFNDEAYISGTFFDKDKIVPSTEVDKLINKYSLMDKIDKYDVSQYYFENKEDCEKVVNALNTMLDKIESN